MRKHTPYIFTAAKELRGILKIISFAIPVLFFVSSCSRVPGYVIPPDKMAEVLADLNIAETVVDNNYPEYPSDSARMLLKQSVLAKHGYTLETLDTSFMWYGANLTKYSEVNEMTVKILEERLAESGVAVAHRAAGGDSVDIWNRPRFLLVRANSPSKTITYNFNDEQKEWTKGDIFTLRAKFSNTSGNTAVSFTANYDDGTFDLLTSRFAGDGWHEVTFFTDSTKTANSLKGSISIQTGSGAIVIDSIGFVRKPLDSQLYSQRYRQRTYDFSNKRHKEVAVPDTAAQAAANADVNLQSANQAPAAPQPVKPIGVPETKAVTTNEKSNEPPRSR